MPCLQLQGTLNIVSPGGLPNNIIIDDIYQGISEVRNKVLANLFKELGLIEKWGTGINRIINICIKNGNKKPLIVEKNDFIDIELYRNKETTQETKKIPTKKKILELITKDKNITREQLSDKIGVSSNTIKQHLSNLKKENKIKRSWKH